MKNINPKAKFLLIVPNINLVTQFYNDILDYNFSFHKENKNPLEIKIEEIMSDNPRKYFGESEPDIYIGTYQSLEKRNSEFFNQFEVVCCDESHQAKAQTLQSILSKTFGTAKFRFGLSGSLPHNSSLEILTIQSVLGPKLIHVGARKLMDKGLISDIKIKVIFLHHDNRKFAEGVYNIRKRGDGRRALELEKEYIHNSAKRKKFIKSLVDKFKQNSLILFHTITYGTELYNYLKDNSLGKDVYYIDGQTKNEKRNYIKKMMEDTSGNPKILVASYGTLQTGVSIRAITNIILGDSFKSQVVVLQSLGRGMRKHSEKNKLIVFDLIDIFHPDFKTILMKQFEARKEIYKKQQFLFDNMDIKL